MGSSHLHHGRWLLRGWCACSQAVAGRGAEVGRMAVAARWNLHLRFHQGTREIQPHRASPLSEGAEASREVRGLRSVASASSRSPVEVRGPRRWRRRRRSRVGSINPEVANLRAQLRRCGWVCGGRAGEEKVGAGAGAPAGIVRGDARMSDPSAPRSSTSLHGRGGVGRVCGGRGGEEKVGAGAGVAAGTGGGAHASDPLAPRSLTSMRD